MIIVQQVKKRINKRNIYCICKNQYQITALQSSESLNFDNFSPSPALAGPIVDSRYVQRSSTLSVNST